MDRLPSEIEQRVTDEIIGQTLTVELGVRSWSSVSKRLPAQKALDDTKLEQVLFVQQSIASDVKQGLRRFWQQKPTPRLIGSTAGAVGLIAVAMFVGDFWIGDGKSTTAKTPAVKPAMPSSVQVASANVPPIAEKPQAEPAIVPKPLDMPDDAVPQPSQVVKHEPVEMTAIIEAKPVETKPVATVAPVVPKPAEPDAQTPKQPVKVIAPVKPAAVAQKPAPEVKQAPRPAAQEAKNPVVEAKPTPPATNAQPVAKPEPVVAPKPAPVVAKQDTAAQPLGLPPPLPASMQSLPRVPPPSGVPGGATTSPAAKQLEEKPLLAVDETHSSANDGRSAQPKQIEPKPIGNIVDPVGVKDEPKKPAPLPKYTILAPSPNGVVISDPTTRLPKEFRVGQKLPNGEVIQAIGRNGEVRTDKRTLNVAD